MRRPVHRGRHDHPITSLIITATHIGTAHSNLSTNVSAIEGRLRNSTHRRTFLHFNGNQRRNEARSTRTIDERKRESLGGVYLSYFPVISEKFSVGNFIEILLLIIVDL
jgi:hypothetical protein